MLRREWAAIVVLVAVASPASAADEVDTIFDASGYDRWLFSPKTGQSGGRWKVADDGLHAIIPRGSEKRTPMWFTAEARLEGDFEIVAAYDGRDLPRPRERPGMPDYAVSNGAEIGFRVGQTWVTVFDTRRPTGEAVGYFIRPPDGKNAYAQVAGGRPLGRLGARRVGPTLTLLHGGSEGELVELGTFEIGTEPAEEVALVPKPVNTTEAIEVVYPRLTLKAARIVRLKRPPRDWTPWIGAAIGLAALAVVGFLGRRWWASRREEKPRVAFGRGFTLIELLVVILIIAILVAPAAPRRAGGAGGGAAVAVRQQPQADRRGPGELRDVPHRLPVRRRRRRPPGSTGRWSPHSQFLPFLDTSPLFNALNFSGLPWVEDPIPLSKMNLTPLRTTISTFLCPSDAPMPEGDPYVLGPNNYRACAGTLPVNLPGDSPDGSGKNDGAFWYQSAVRPSSVRDGLSNTAMFSERLHPQAGSRRPEGRLPAHGRLGRLVHVGRPGDVARARRGPPAPGVSLGRRRRRLHALHQPAAARRPLVRPRRVERLREPDLLDGHEPAPRRREPPARRRLGPGRQGDGRPGDLAGPRHDCRGRDGLSGQLLSRPGASSAGAARPIVRVAP